MTAEDMNEDYEEGLRAIAELGDFRQMGGLVCVCMGIPRDTIVEAIRRGELRSVEEVSNRTTAATGCGSCAHEVDLLIRAYWEERGK